MLGGAGMVARQNAESLAGRGHQVTVLTRIAGSCLEKSHQINIVGVPGGSKFWVLFFALKLRLMDLGKFDTIIINDVGAALVFSLSFFGENIHSRCFVYFHGSECNKFFIKPSIFFKIFYLRKKYKKFLSQCHKIISVSYFLKNEIVRYLPSDFDIQKIKVVSNGVDHSMFRPTLSDVRSDLGIPRSTILLFSVGRIVKEKGFFVMLDLFEKLSQGPNRFFWIVAGNGPDLETLKVQAAQGNVSDNIRFLGPVARDELPRYYSAADLFWLLSSREAFSLVSIEAQMCGCPVLCLGGHGMSETILSRDSGFVVDNASLALDVLAQLRFKELNRKKIRTSAKRFSVERQIDMLESVLFS